MPFEHITIGRDPYDRAQEQLHKTQETLRDLEFQHAAETDPVAKAALASAVTTARTHRDEAKAQMDTWNICMCAIIAVALLIMVGFFVWMSSIS